MPIGFLSVLVAIAAYDESKARITPNTEIRGEAPSLAPASSAASHCCTTRSFRPLSDSVRDALQLRKNTGAINTCEPEEALDLGYGRRVQSEAPDTAWKGLIEWVE